MLFRVIAAVASLACIVHGALTPLTVDDAVTRLKDEIDAILDATEDLTDAVINAYNPVTVQTTIQVGRGHLARMAY